MAAKRLAKFSTVDLCHQARRINFYTIPVSSHLVIQHLFTVYLPIFTLIHNPLMKLTSYCMTRVPEGFHLVLKHVITDYIHLDSQFLVKNRCTNIVPETFHLVLKHIITVYIYFYSQFLDEIAIVSLHRLWKLFASVGTWAS